MAGHRGAIATASTGWRLILTLCLLFCLVRVSAAQAPQVFDIDLHTANLAEALNNLSEQTGVPVVFSYDLVKDRKANPVVGRYSLPEALNALLKDSGLSGGLSEKGVLTVSLAKPVAPEKRGETFVTQADQQQNTNKSRAARTAGIATFFAAIASAFTAHAQDASEASSDAEPRIAEVLVTAQKREERLQDVPESITVLDTRNLAESGQSRLIDYFASVPGLSISAGGNGNTFVVMRGLSAGNPLSNGGQNPLVATVIDDVPVTASTLAGGGQITSPDLDPSDLARIEVLKGPQGTLYGADSLSGLIKYVTVEPSTAAWSGRAEVAGAGVLDGSQGFAIRGAVNIPVSDTLAFRVSTFGRHDPGYIDQLTTGEKNFNSTDLYGGHIAALWRPFDNFSLKLTALFQQSDGESSFFDSTISGQSAHNQLGLTALPDTTLYSTQIQLYSANMEWKVLGLDVVSITGLVMNSYRNVTDWTGNLGGVLYNCYHEATPPCQLAPGAPTGMVGSSALHDIETQKVSQELRVGSSIGTWLDWRLGGFYTHERSPTNIDNFYGSDPTTGRYLFTSYTNNFFKQKFNEYAVFGDLTLHLTDRLSIEAGGRQSWNNQTNQYEDVGAAVYLFTGSPPPYISPLESASGSAFTYQVTPELKISRDLMVYARVATGYRVGGYNQDAFIPSYSPLGIPTSYSPDKTTNYELGLKGDFLDHSLVVDLAGYHISWKDFQTNVSRPYQVAGATAFIGYTVNGGQAKSDGVELSVEAHPLQGLTLALQGAYDNAVLTQDLPTGSAYGLKGFRLPYSMKFSGGVTINQDIRVSDAWTAFVGGSANYIDGRPQEFTGDATQPRIVYPSYTQLNFKLGARSEAWLMNLYVNNATDRRGVVGITNSYSLNSPHGYIATVIQPRTIGVSLARTF